MDIQLTKQQAKDLRWLDGIIVADNTVWAYYDGILHTTADYTETTDGVMIGRVLPALPLPEYCEIIHNTRTSVNVRERVLDKYPDTSMYFDLPHGQAVDAAELRLALRDDDVTLLQTADGDTMSVTVNGAGVIVRCGALAEMFDRQRLTLALEDNDGRAVFGATERLPVRVLGTTRQAVLMPLEIGDGA